MKRVCRFDWNPNRSRGVVVSIAVMRWVWDHSKATLADRLVLLAIADCCRFDNGTGAFPSVAELVRKTALGERTVQKSLKSLTALGELQVAFGGGRSGTNRYRVMVTKAATEPASEEQNSRSEVETPQDLHPVDPAGGDGGLFPQVNLENPADPAPPAGSAPPAESALNPAGSAPGTIKNRKKNNPPTEGMATEQTAKTSKATRLPLDWTPDDRLLAMFPKKWPLLDPPHEIEQFQLYWWGEGKPMKNWDMTFQRRMNDQQKRAEKQGRFHGRTRQQVNGFQGHRTEEYGAWK